MAQHHKYSISEIENMIPFERDLYVQMIKNYIEKLKVKANGCTSSS
jgi:hypothetical protein